jgi:hypothetical protein
MDPDLGGPKTFRRIRIRIPNIGLKVMLKFYANFIIFWQVDAEGYARAPLC